MEPNYEQDGAEQPANQDTLKVLSKEAGEVVVLQDRITKGEKLLKDLKKEVETKTCTVIPELMQEVNMDSFKLGSGHGVTIKPFIECNIPSKTAINRCKDEDDREALIDRKEDAFSWLEENQGGGLISDTVTITIPKGDEAFREEVLAVLCENKFPHEEDKSVHAGSLKKFLREKIENGVDVPQDVFSLFQGERAEIK